VQVNDAVERLERLGFLERTADGCWLDRSGSITTVGNEFTVAAFRRLQRSILEQAIVALEELPLSARDQTSMTMAANSALLEPARKKIQKFRRDLCAFLQSQGPLDQVFHLNVSLYPVMRPDPSAKGKPL
jgi:uncharacterized protein (TIGR02147 family)